MTATSPIKRQSGSRTGRCVTVLALTITFALLAIFIILYIFLLDYYPTEITALTEVHDLFTSVDVRAQTISLIISLFLFAISLAALFLFGEAEVCRSLIRQLRRLIPLRFRCYARQVVGFVLESERWLTSSLKPNGVLRKISAYPDAVRLIVTTALWFACFAALMPIGVSWSQKDSFNPETVRLIFWADPHIAQVFGIVGEQLLGDFQHSTFEIKPYGLGAPLAYSVARFFGLPAEYKTAFDVTRIANILFLGCIVGSLFVFWRSRFHTFWVGALVLVTILTVAGPLLQSNGYATLFANLSGLRYIPIGMCLVVVSMRAPHKGWVEFTFLSILTALGIAYSPDIGLVAALGLAVAIGLDETTVIRKLLRGFVFIVTATLAYAVLVLLVFLLTGIRIDTVWTGVGQVAGESFGGLSITWQLGMTTVFCLSAGCTFIVTSLAHHRSLSKQESLALVASLMSLVLLIYYMHRPYDYIVFWSLALFPLSLLFHVASAGDGLAKLAAVGLSAALATSSQVQLESSPAKTPNGDVQMTRWSGLMIPTNVAAKLNQRLADLPAVGQKRAVVVTGIPYAVTATKKLTTVPIEAVFELGTEKKIDNLISRLKIAPPDLLIVDAFGSQSMGPDSIVAISARLEAAIRNDYILNSDSRSWRVWQRKMGVLRGVQLK